MSIYDGWLFLLVGEYTYMYSFVVHVHLIQEVVVIRLWFLVTPLLGIHTTTSIAWIKIKAMAIV